MGVYIDLFAGCGGLSLGLKNSTSWTGLFAIERSPMAFETLKFNLLDCEPHFDWPEWLAPTEHSIESVLCDHSKNLRKLKGKVDLIAGGPPCQGFSTAGLRRRRDKRNLLVDQYLQFVQVVTPKLVFFENVTGFSMKFRSTDKSAPSHKVIHRLNELGYNVHWEIVDFSQFGIPQKRKRFILVGSLCAPAREFFARLYESKNAFLQRKGISEVTVSEAIGDLEQRHGTSADPEQPRFEIGHYGPALSSYQRLMRQSIRHKTVDSHRFPNHNQGTLARFQVIQELQSPGTRLDEHIRDQLQIRRWGPTLLAPSNPSPTVTSLPDDLLHYSEPRILTVRELARIQSFPDRYRFKGKYSTGGKQRKTEVPRYTQVGNAIPPLFAEQASPILKSLLDG
jgi:DNA (cytosine-5)-methyltransferase 1